MNISPAVITPSALGESCQPNLVPFLTSKADEVLREINYQPAIHQLLPDVDIRGLTQIEAHERMIRMHARLGEYDFRILNLRKLSPDEPSLPEARTSLLKERHNIMQFMQVLETTSGISMFFTTVPMPPNYRTSKTYPRLTENGHKFAIERERGYIC